MSKLLDTALSFIGLGGIPERGAKTKSSDTRLKSANDARKLFHECLREDNAGRSLERAIVKGCCDGNPPYPEPRPAERKWEANLNLGKLKGVMKRTGVPYFNLFARVQCFIECRTAYQPDNPDQDRWNSSIAIRFHNLLKRWKPGFQTGIQQISYWMRLHGVGFAFRDKSFDWRFRHVETGNVLVPKGSPSCLDKRIPYVFIRMPYRLTELWEKIRDEKSATAAGANIDAIRNALKFGMRGMFSTPTGGINDWYNRPWEEYQRILTNNDLVASFTDSDIIQCAVMLLLEYSGKISKFVFTEFPVFPTDNPTSPPPGNVNDAFLFSDPNCYDEYLECLVAFFRDGADGTWHSVRGYAQESFKHVEVENRMLCQGINRAFINSSVVLKFLNERARTMGQLRVMGTVVSLPVGSEFQQVFLQGGIEDLVVMQRLLGNHLDNNIGIGTARGMSRDDGRGETKTAREVDYTSANEGSIGEAEITNFYEQLDSLYQMMFDVAADPSTSDTEAKRFQKECLTDGVPKEALTDMEYVRASRQNGYGSPEMAQLKFDQSKDLVPMLPEDGKIRWLKNAITSIHGPQAAKELVPDTHIPNDQDWQADIENGIIAMGRLPEVTAGQDDVIHLQRHFADAQQTLQPVAQSLQNNPNGQQQDPQALESTNGYAQLMAQHIEEHINRLQHDPSRRNAAKLFEDQFRQLAQFSQALWRALRSAKRAVQINQEQAGQATSLGALDQAKVDSVRTQTALAAQKVQSQIGNQRAKTVQGMGIKEAKAKQDLRITAQKHAIEVPADALAGAERFTE